MRALQRVLIVLVFALVTAHLSAQTDTMLPPTVFPKIQLFSADTANLNVRLESTIYSGWSWGVRAAPDSSGILLAIETDSTIVIKIAGVGSSCGHDFPWIYSADTAGTLELTPMDLRICQGYYYSDVILTFRKVPNPNAVKITRVVLRDDGSAPVSIKHE